MSDVNKAAMLRWVERLERNEDPQGKGYLNSEQGMCCLGVAADEFAEELGITAKTVKKGGQAWGDEEVTYIDVVEYSWPSEPFTEDSTRAVPPAPVVEHLGLPGDNPLINTEEFGYQALAHLNDHKGLTFPQIAALIRKAYDL